MRVRASGLVDRKSEWSCTSAVMAAAAIDEDAVNNPANPDVPDDIATEVDAASAEYDAEKAFMDANANSPDP